jgi:hypothetical protein
MLKTARFALAVSFLVCAVSVAAADGVRFTGGDRVVQMRVQVMTSGSALVYDSDWKSGSLIDWPIERALAYGSYWLVIRTRDLDGRSAERQTTLRVDPQGMALEDQPGESPKITLTAHDGEVGQLVTTSGDLSFRFGDFLNRKDVEVMRLTAQGDLDVSGLIRAGKGIVFPDGSIQRSAAMPSIVRMRPSSPESDKKLTPKSEISGAGTTNQITKWFDGPAGQVGDSAVSEVAGKVGIGTTNPGAQLHIYGAVSADVFAGMGPDVINGPGFNFGYAGNSFGTGAGFFNVRPAAGAVGVNPSLRFMTVDQQRMIITNVGNVGIGTSTPTEKLDVAGGVSLSGNLRLPATSTTAGVITVGGARFAHSVGTANTFLGQYAGNLTMNGASNTGSGYSALNSNTSGGHNTATGTYSLSSNTTGSYNTATGEGVLVGNTTGSDNTAAGAGAMEHNTAGAGNTVSGSGALFYNTTGNYNTATGVAALTFNDGSNNTADGYISLYSNTTGMNNTASGYSALYGNTTGSVNTAVGAYALQANTTASYNTATGDYALYSNTTGNNNTASGYYALYGNADGYQNTASGVSALQANTSGFNNTAFGYSALFGNISGAGNTAIGRGALANNITGVGNIALGEQAGWLTTGSNNILIGNANVGVGSEASTIRIGAVGGQTRTFIAGIRNVTTGAADAIAVLIDSNGQLGTVSSSRRVKFDIASMGDTTDSLMRLRPVTFRYLKHGDHAPLQYGLIAEEVAEIYPELVARNKDGEVETVMYQFLAPMLLNQVQKQQKTIDALNTAFEAQQGTIAALNTTLEELGQQLRALKRQIGSSN